MAEQQPLTLFVKLRVKEGREQEFVDTMTQTAKVCLAEETGCLAYRLFKVQGKPREYMIFEQYRDHAALAEHGKHLQALHGPLPAHGGPIPAKLMDLNESDETSFCFEVIE
jgi:quinol monooxygenase YgiN